MSTLRTFIIAVLVSFPLSVAHADELKNFLIKLTDAKNYPYQLLNDEYRAYFNVGENYLAVDKNGLKELYEEQKKVMLEPPVIKNFRILSRSDSKFFTSVTYEYDWSAKLGETNMEGVLSAHSILQKTNTGWTVIFDAITQ